MKASSFDIDDILKKVSIAFDIDCLLEPHCITHIVPFVFLVLGNMASNVVQTDCQDAVPIHALQEVIIYFLRSISCMVKVLLSIYHWQAFSAAVSTVPLPSIASLLRYVPGLS